jgi:enoyl-CoA hydratase/carnithine racemase
VVTVSLERPAARNAQTPATWQALTAVGEWVGSSAPDPVRVVVLRGDGPAFSAGLDRAMLGASSPLVGLARLSDAELDSVLAGYQSAFTWLRAVPAVTVAAVQGPAVGAGFQLALACDLRVVADDVRFAMRETSLGLVPDLAGTAPLVRLVGPARALEMCLTGREVAAAEAVASGLAALAVPVDALAAATADLLAALLAAPPPAVAATLQLLRGAAERDESTQRAAERAAQAPLLRALLTGRGGP